MLALVWFDYSKCGLGPACFFYRKSKNESPRRVSLEVLMTYLDCVCSGNPKVRPWVPGLWPAKILIPKPEIKVVPSLSFPVLVAVFVVVLVIFVVLVLTLLIGVAILQLQVR